MPVDRRVLVCQLCGQKTKKLAKRYSIFLCIDCLKGERDGEKEQAIFDRVR